MVAVVSFLLPSVVSEFLEVVVYGLSALAIAAMPLMVPVPHAAW
jgi:hypothetical protein